MSIKINNKLKLVIATIIALVIVAFTVNWAIGQFGGSAGNLNKGLVAHWALDSEHYNSTTSRVDDLTPYGNHGTNYGATVGSNYSTFDGGDYIQASDSSSLDITNAITLEAWAQDPPSYIFSDGFESGTLITTDTPAGMWDSKTGSPTVQDTIKHGGNYALYSAPDAAGYVVKNISAISPVYVRGYFYFTVGPWAQYYGGEIISAAGPEYPAYYYHIDLKNNGSDYVLVAITGYGTVWGTTPIELNKWYMIEMVATSADGVYAYLDGVQEVHSGSGLPQTFDTIRVGVTGSLGSAGYLDSVAIDDEYIGAESISTAKTIISKGTDAYALQIDGTTLKGYINDTEISTSIATPLEWHHYVMTYDGSNQKLYIDGVLSATVAKTGAISTNSIDLKIGEYFNGDIDDVRIYNRALSATEILDLYNLNHRDQALSTGSLNKGLVGQWKLDSAHYNSTTARVDDLTPYGNHGTNYGATVGSEYTTFDGVDDYIEIPDSNSLDLANEFSIGLWVKKNANPSASYDFLVGKGSGFSSGGAFTIGLDSTGYLICFARKADNTGYNYPPYTSLGTDWTHIVFVGKGGQYLKEFRNGVERSTLTIDWTFYVNNLPVWIGKGQSYHNGLIDDVRIYNRALSATEVSDLYNLNHRDQVMSTGSLNKGLVGQWKLDSAHYNSTTARVDDSTPYGNHGTNYSATVGSEYTTFNGSNNYIIVPNSTSLQNSVGTWTFWIWIDPTQMNVCPRIISRYGSGVGYEIVFVDATRTLGIARMGASAWEEVLYSTAVQRGVWLHCAISIDAVNNVKAYINGVYKSGKTWISPIVPSTGNLTIASSPSTSFRFNGFLDNVRIYNRDLSTTEIQTLYEAGRN